MQQNRLLLIQTHTKYAYVILSISKKDFYQIFLFNRFEIFIKPNYYLETGWTNFSSILKQPKKNYQHL